MNFLWVLGLLGLKVTTVSGTCPSIGGFTQIGDFLYNPEHAKKKRNQAIVACEDRGAKLATFMTDAQFAAVRSIMPNEDTWVGMLNNFLIECDSAAACNKKLRFLKYTDQWFDSTQLTTVPGWDVKEDDRCIMLTSSGEVKTKYESN